MTESSSLAEPACLEEPKKTCKESAVFEVSEEVAIGLNSSESCSASSSASSSVSCIGYPNENRSETTSITTATTSTDSGSSSAASKMASKKEKKQLIKEEREAALQNVLLAQLENQIAYYFSPANLATDTFCRTLQELNDGCVPVQALANFGKIKSILWATPSLTKKYVEESSRMDMIVRAVEERDSPLIVENIDTTTGKAVTGSDSERASTIKGVRLTQDANLDSIRSSPMNAARPQPVSNTILLRDVNPEVTYEQVHNLFLKEVDNCPPVLSLQRDVANCWFVVLDCDSRDLMLDIVLQLRSLAIGGDYIHARLKASTVHQAPSLDPVAIKIAQHVPARKKNKKRGMKNKKKKPVSFKLERQKSNNALGDEWTWTQNSKASEKGLPAVQPPPLMDEDFPSLLDSAPECDPLPEEAESTERDERNVSSLDSEGRGDKHVAATSSPSRRGGYAAAVMNTAESIPVRAKNALKDGRKAH